MWKIANFYTMWCEVMQVIMVSNCRPKIGGSLMIDFSIGFINWLIKAIQKDKKFSCLKSGKKITN
jgi:hypothetical protein